MCWNILLISILLTGLIFFDGEIYASYFMQLMDKEADFKVDGSTSQQIY